MLPRVVEGTRRGLIESIESGIAVAQHRLPQSAERYLMALGLLVSALLALGMITVHVRLSRTRQHWPTTILRGVRVRVSPEVGPAVIGLTRPEIVVPRWLLGRDPEEQQLVLAHEVEHVRSCDHVLLAVACVAVVLVPWNPAIWWMLAQLRLTVELDCDARVLRRGVAPRKYGALLIDLAEHGSGFRLGAATFTDSSHLSQRLNAMKPDIPSFARTRGIAIGILAFSSVLIACETSIPTSDQVSRIDASSAERAAAQNRMLQRNDNDAVFSVDGAVVTAAAARALPSAQISSIEIVKSSGNRPQIRISTRKAGDTVQSPDSTLMGAALAEAAPPVGPVASPKEQGDTWTAHHVIDPKARFSGVFLIDGARVDRAAVDALEPGSVISIDLMKGTEATVTRYNDPLAANGVMAFTTRSTTKP
jgi:hypothetical protein